MAVAKTEGVLIKYSKFRETSLIVTFYTRDFGLLKAVAKGARGPKSNFRSSLDLFTHGQLVAYVKDDRDLQLLSDFDATRTYRGIHEDVLRFAFAGAAGELIEALVAGQEANPELLDLLLEFLGLLESSGREALGTLFRAYQLKASSILGYRPELGRCAGCGSLNGARGFSPRLGGLVCPGCASEAFGATGISESALEAFRLLDTRPLSELASGGVDGARVEREIGPLLEAFLQYHVDRYKGLKSLGFLRKLGV